MAKDKVQGDLMNHIYTQQGDTLDLICWRYYGRTAGITEVVLKANINLADSGPIIPQGTLITLPDIAIQQKQYGIINLWD